MLKPVINQLVEERVKDLRRSAGRARPGKHPRPAWDHRERPVSPEDRRDVRLLLLAPPF